MEKSVPNSTLFGRHSALPRTPTIQNNIVAKGTYEVFILFYFIFEIETSVPRLASKLLNSWGWPRTLTTFPLPSKCQVSRCVCLGMRPASCLFIFIMCVYVLLQWRGGRQACGGQRATPQGQFSPSTSRDQTHISRFALQVSLPTATYHRPYL